VWSHLYSLSFEPNPRWSREYPTQPEIQRYLTGVAQKYELERNIRFGSEVTDCAFDTGSGLWSTQTRDGTTFRSRFLVSAVGQLNSPQLPDIDKLQDFQGKAMHSARWDKSYNLSGKSVAVIGNGKLQDPHRCPTPSNLTLSRRNSYSDCPSGREGSSESCGVPKIAKLDHAEERCGHWAVATCSL